MVHCPPFVSPWCPYRQTHQQQSWQERRRLPKLQQPLQPQPKTVSTPTDALHVCLVQCCFNGATESSSPRQKIAETQLGQVINFVCESKLAGGEILPITDTAVR